jgi:nickel-type superoxide dismutase maturation protease
MAPFLKPGELVFVDFGAYRRVRPQAGEVVVLWHPGKKNLRIIKRIVTVTPTGQYVVRGDNAAASTDSRSFGPVSVEAIIGRVA